MSNVRKAAGEAGPATVLPHPAAQHQQPSRLLQRIHERWQDFACRGLAQLLLDLDDDLFSRADAAESDAMQSAYFDAMRALRLDTSGIQQRFLELLKSGFADGAEDETGNSESRLAKLTLMDDDALEQRLAIGAMTQRFEHGRSLDVLLAERRIKELRTQTVGASSALNAELSPRRVAEAFAEALRPVALQSHVRLLLFKHFEQQVMARFPELFKELNRLLVAGGVLPDLDLGKESRQNAVGADSAPADDPRTHSDGEGHYGHRESGGAAGTAPWHDNSSGGFESQYDLGPAMRRRASLMRRLPGLRRRRRFEQGDDPNAVLSIRSVLQLLQRSEGFDDRDWGSLDHVPQRIDLGALLVEQARRSGRSDAALDSVDEDTVNLIQMLFDLILEDDNQAIPMRALIARLQFPMLRVALADSTFFSDARHPARQFLNSVSRAGIGWARADEKTRDRLYAQIEELIGRAASFDGSVDHFLVLKLELDRALEAEAASVRRAAEQIIAQEQARVAAERTRLLVSKLVELRIGNCDPSPALRQFLQSDWQHVMLRAHGDPDAWRQAFAVLRRLTGSKSGPSGVELQDAISAGLERINQSPVGARAAAAEVLAAWIDNLEAREASPLEPLPDSAAETVREHEPEPDQEVAESIAALDAEETQAVSAEEVPADALYISEAAQALQQNTWVELETRSGRLVRCRLAAVTDQPERCIFLNRRGLRIDTLSRLEIARAMTAGRLRILDDRQLFDRALEQVIGGLRNEAKASTA